MGSLSLCFATSCSLNSVSRGADSAAVGTSEETVSLAAKEVSKEALPSSNYKDKTKHYKIDWPVDKARFVRGFLPDRGRKRRKHHYGLDLAAPPKTPVLAAHDGVVIYVGQGFRGYGKMIMLQSQEGFATLYAHLSKISVSEGTQVQRGEIIGGIGRTGRAKGYHLHFELRTKEGPVDPLPYLPPVHLAVNKEAELRNLAHFESQADIDSED